MFLESKDFKKHLVENISVHKSLVNNSEVLYQIIKLFSNKLKNGNSIFICGNGGSASDAEHLSTEFLVRLRPKINRKPFKIINLGMNIPYITACANDYSFQNVFSRSLEAISKPNDVLWVISTSGNSKNIIKALNKAKKLKIKTVGFYGKTGGKCKKLTDYSILVKSNKTARIQECHIFLGHYILEKTENNLTK